LFIPPSEEGPDREACLALIKAFHYISEKESPGKGLSFITDVSTAIGSSCPTYNIIIVTQTMTISQDLCAVDLRVMGSVLLLRCIFAGFLQYFNVISLGTTQCRIKSQDAVL